MIRLSDISFVVALLFLAVGDSPAAGSSSAYTVERVPPDRRVALHLTYCMTQTRDGFLWFGTMYGLLRYDGYSYEAYRYDPDNPSSLSNDDITALFEDHRGDLWIGTYGGGLNRFDRSTGTFERMFDDGDTTGGVAPRFVWAIAEDSSGVVWIGTENNGLIGVREGRPTYIFRHDEDSPASLRTNRIHDIKVDSRNRVWAANTGGGVCRIDPDREKPVYLSFPQIRDGGRTVSSLLLDETNKLWFGAFPGQVGVFDPESGLLELHALTSRSYPHVNMLVPGDKGIVYAGTSEGVFALDRSGSVVAAIRSDPKDPGSLQINSAQAMCLDWSGILWVSCYPAGISRIHTATTEIRTFVPDPSASTGSAENRIVSLCKAFGADSLLAVTGRALYLVRPNFGVIDQLAIPASVTKEGGGLTAVLQDSRHTVWLGTRNGLFRVSPDGRLAGVYRHSDDPASISGNVINVLLESSEGEIWAGTSSGLNRFSYEAGSFLRYVAVPGGLRDEYILSLFEDRKGSLWIGTYGGTSVLDRASGTFLHFVQEGRNPSGISNNYALAFSEDGNGTVWIGTGGGLNRFDSDRGVFRHYFENDGLSTSVISGIVRSEDGDLWISTPAGIDRFHAGSESFTAVEAGPPEGRMFTAGATTILPSGKIAFGGDNGVTIIDPVSVTARSFDPPVAITGFRLLTNRSDDGDPVIAGDSVSLSYRQNQFEVSFASLDFLDPERNRYSYRLDGLDEEWVPGDDRHNAVFTAMDPGSYLLRVRGTNSDGVWSSREARMFITITPPFWRTWWFTGLLVAAAAVSLYALHRFRMGLRIRREKEHEAVRFEEAERIRKKAARDFHDEFGHRLTKISLFAEIVKRRIINDEPETAARVDKIIEASQVLTEDTRSFLWTLDPSHDSLYDLVEYLNTFGEELFDRTGIAFRPSEATDDMKSVMLTMDFRRHLALIVKEAMNNALRHAHCSEVLLSASSAGGGVSISLRDDGKGFDKPSVAGGLGVKNMRQRAERISGSLEIDSGPGRGTSIRFASRAA